MPPNPVKLKEKIALCDAFTVAERDFLLEIMDEIEGQRELFRLQWEADRRAVRRWQDAHPEQPFVMPDRTDLMVWLMQQLEARKH